MGRIDFFLSLLERKEQLKRICQLLWTTQEDERGRTDRILGVFVAIGLESEG